MILNLYHVRVAGQGAVYISTHLGGNKLITARWSREIPVAASNPGLALRAAAEIYPTLLDVEGKPWLEMVAEDTALVGPVVVSGPSEFE